MPRDKLGSDERYLKCLEHRGIQRDQVLSQHRSSNLYISFKALFAGSNTIHLIVMLLLCV